ncbi:pyruvate dehydrogenase E1 component alpha subunit [Barrientosiimonas humi]|uniref:Pyruvate dehydrogenase E1 component alpha subunit n=1 Tax=Barrientosiimonas humi TaxID=999931 RepID=A0A542XFF1_9MICO|nr:pyruvate dehydrogenase (acetyl-transferring) E1 component subunit alpha [Barrientosiimonas humi]TQL34554.1 pyruvate dehydrogenase E1 component alpha subunit [Barrientosiimonas humi]CAG7574544.1 3-methyl-2-oxobutanoate dehydrogenase subunit alpha [Barrientosiimonas humi]
METTVAGAPPTDLPTDVAALLPSPVPVQLLDAHGAAGRESHGDYAMPSDERLLEVWRRMVLGRRLDIQCTALTKQGRLAVYPSSRGQEACQVGAVLGITERDWMFPTYRESVALFTRGIDPVEALSLLRGDAHCGYDPTAHKTAPQCTPLSTQLVHAAGAAYGERRRGSDAVAMAFIGDGATSEGDFHEALNFAAVFRAPVIFFVQNNKYAISVPLAKQSKAPSLAYKGIGYGIRSEQVDGNDPAAVLAVVDAAVEHARAGHGPFLVEAHTYRLDAHTNADDATRYRQADEVTEWLAKDPIARLQAYLEGRGVVDQALVEETDAEGERLATDLRDRMNVDPVVDPATLFDHVYAEPTPQLREQRAMVLDELAAEGGDH